jgi:hypothetical protein
MNKENRGFGYLILLAPLIFIFHFTEESAGFVAWFNAHVDRGINSSLFWQVNISALGITVLVALFGFYSPSAVSDGMVLCWLGFLMLANAIFHITAALKDGKYMPGLVTAVILYLPYFYLVARKVIRSGRISPLVLVILTLLGGIPMYIHGYRIIFLRGRLF